MTGQASVGGAVLGTGLGVGAAGAAPGRGGGAQAAEGVQNQATGTPRVLSQAAGELAQTGANDTMLLLTAAFILVVMGLLLMGLARRHAGPTGAPPLLA